MIDKYISLVKKFYDEDHRKFHNWGHIEYGLNLFNLLKTGSSEQKIAWLFHDIIYDPTKKDNESKSAIFAIDMITKNGDEKNVNLDLVSIIINDTAKHIPTHKESALVLDIDMSSLAIADYKEFVVSRIEAAKEYAFYGKEAVVAGTKAFIADTLSHDRIFTTNEFKPMEDIARKNLSLYLLEFEKNEEFLSIFNKPKVKFKI
jgi:predicted metal-dependent HD superfamily phosphohydrolase